MREASGFTAAVGVVLLVACAEPAAPAQAVSDDEASEVALVEVEAGAATAVLTAPARLVATATASAEVSFLASGTVRRVFTRPGDTVEQGAKLVEIASPELAAAAGEWRSLTETLKIAQRRLDRLEALAAERIASEDELQARRADIARLRGRRREVQGRLLAHGVTRDVFDEIYRSGGVVVSSPVTGIVRRLDLRLGQAVRPEGPPLAVVIGAGQPRVEAMLESRPSPGLAYVFIASDGERLRVGRSLGSLPDPDTGTWTTWFALADDVSLVGERVGELEGSAEGPDVFTVPADALGSDERGAYLLRAKDDAFQRVPVTVLHLDDEVAVVRAELSTGDRVARDPRAAHSKDGA